MLVLQPFKNLDQPPKSIDTVLGITFTKILHLEGYLSSGLKVLSVNILNLFWQLRGLTNFCWSE